MNTLHTVLFAEPLNLLRVFIKNIKVKIIIIFRRCVDTKSKKYIK